MTSRKFAGDRCDTNLPHCFIFDYQKTLIKLSFVLLVAILIVIRGSTAPLICNCAVLRVLFYSDPNGDKTLYNVGISIIAAFVFYIFQVYIPSQKNFKRNLSTFNLDIRYEIFLLNQYVIAWEQFLGKEPGTCYFFEFDYVFYETEKLCGTHNTVTKFTYNATIDELPKVLERIISNPYFRDCDIAFQSYIINSLWQIKGKLKFMDDQLPRWHDKALIAEDYRQILIYHLEPLRKIQRKLSAIEKYRINVVSIKERALEDAEKNEDE